MFQFAGRKPPHAAESTGPEGSSGPVERSAAPSAAHDVLRSAGTPLDDSTRRDMEGRLGADFSRVRVHTDGAAQRSATEFRAQAYTSGHHIVAGRGGLDRETLAHELVHVLQQRQGPVAGTDAGHGLRVSDPGDRYEREAEAGARRAMSGAAPVPVPAARAPGEPAIGPVQRKLGFEVEIDLPVVDQNRQPFEGDTPLGTSTIPLLPGQPAEGPAFNLVTDYRSDDNDNLYSNMEFVTGAASVIGPAQASGPARLRQIVDEMRTVQQQFYALAAANPNTPLENANIRLTLTNAARTASVPSNVAFTDTREASRGEPEEQREGGLFIHYSVGIPITGIPGFFNQLRTADPVNRTYDPYNSNLQQRPGDQVTQARLRLVQAAQFSQGAIARFRTWPGAQNPTAREEAALDGYLQLVYTQLAAVTDFGEGEAQSQPKNNLIALSRSNLADVRARLPQRVRNFLDTFDVDDENNIFAELFDPLQERNLAGTGEYNPANERQVDPSSRTVTFANYANSAFRNAGSELPGGDVTQQEVFGGLNTIAPHDEHGSVLVPLEIRRLGGGTKTWEQLKQDLTRLAAWAQAAYQTDQAL